MQHQLTKQDIQKMEEEIEYRKLVVRKEALEDVKTARAHGDLSENFESVMKLPFEMIKFERHCIKRASEQTMYYDVVGTLVDLFREQGFLVAFKGIDNVQLEEVAISLGADFLQGEKYTKPFPVDQIEEQPDLQIVF